MFYKNRIIKMIQCWYNEKKDKMFGIVDYNDKMIIIEVDKKQNNEEENNNED